jgi:poly-gamma-glutamate synthesis protein (capsule biosynthesis protein)
VIAFTTPAPRASKKAALWPLGALVIAALALSFAACGGDIRGGTLSLDADADLLPRLKKLLADRPLPTGWILATSSDRAAVAISLRSLAPSLPLPRGAVIIGTRYLAASAELADDVFSVSSRRALESGLVSLESIVLPRRALAVDGLWPGDPDYPFAQRLVLSVSSAGSGQTFWASSYGSISKWLEDVAEAAKASDPRPLVLAAAGDIQIGEKQWPLLAKGEEGLSSLIRGGVLDLLRKPDIAVANLESSISVRGIPNPRKRYRFRMPPGSAAALKRAGLGLLLLGNNHAFDFGEEAFDDTLVDLEKNGLPIVGAGRNLANAAAARFIETGPSRLAFVGYAFYPDESLGFTTAEAAAGTDRAGVSADEASAMASVRGAAAAGACVVVLAHGGAEYVQKPTAAAKRLYARFVDAGAALVIGSHPHLLQGCEARSGSLIAYSLGNFLFTGETEPPEAWKSAVLDFLLYRGKVRGLMIRPIIAGYDFTTVDPGQDSAEARFAGLCAELSVKK